MSKLTIKDISEMAGVSKTAVSFVLNNKSGVSEETRQKVLEIIKQTNYTPNVNSRRLILQRSFNISVVVKDNSSPFSNLFYMQVITGMLNRCQDFGYNLMFSSIEEPIHNCPLYHNMIQGNTDGIIFLQDINSSIQQEIEQHKIPYIIVDTHKRNPNYVSIGCDYKLASYTAVNYLINKGHKDIAFIGMEEIPDFYLTTFSGYKEALSEANLSFLPDWVQSNAKDEDSAFICMKDILNSPKTPSAVFCASDILAIGAMNYAKSQGLIIPNDMSFFGLDNIILSRYIEPGLSTIKIDEEDMGSKAVELLVKLINKEECESYNVNSDTIIERGSVKVIG